MSVIYLFMYINVTTITFYFIIKSLFSIRFFKTLAPQHCALAIDYSDIIVVMASSSFDTLNVIYCSHMLIKLVCLPQIYVHSSPYTQLVNQQECFKQIITTVIFSRNHQPRRPRLLPHFMLMPCRFIRCNFIGHHGWNGWESTDQPRSFCYHVHLHMI